MLRGTNPSHINSNLYHYAGNNPVRYVDPDGRSAKGAVLGWTGTDTLVPDPTDAVIWKWLGYGVVFLGAAILDIFIKDVVSDAVDNSINNQQTSSFTTSNSKSVVVSPNPLPPDSGDEEKQNKPTSQNQMQKQVERGQAPKEIERVDKAHQKGGQNHVHFKDGTSLNQDGSVHDAHKGVPNPSNAAKEWLKNNGWNCGE